LLPDIVKPNVIIDIVDTALNDADRTSQVTFTFSEAIGAGLTGRKPSTAARAGCATC